jgi:ferrous iron transport protein A
VKTPDSAAGSARSTAATLAELPDGAEATVSGLTQVAGLEGDQASVLVTRLRDLGFIAGARCKVVARMWPGGDPIAVRVGGSTFALRRAEACAVQLGARP